MFEGSIPNSYGEAEEEHKNLNWRQNEMWLMFEHGITRLQDTLPFRFWGGSGLAILEECAFRHNQVWWCRSKPERNAVAGRWYQVSLFYVINFRKKFTSLTSGSKWVGREKAKVIFYPELYDFRKRIAFTEVSRLLLSC